MFTTDLPVSVVSLLKEAKQILDRMERESESKFISGCEAVKATIESSLEMLDENLPGRNIFLLGDNGTGKSWILNLLLFVSQASGERYKNWKRSEPGGDLEALHDTNNEADVRRMQKDFAPVPGDLQDLRESLRKYVSKRAQLRPQTDFRYFVLPSLDEGKSTTPVVTQVRFGKTWHLLIEYDSLDELCQKAYDYVETLRKQREEELEIEDVEELNAMQDRFENLVDEKYNEGLTDGSIKVKSPADIEKYLKQDLLDLAEKAVIFAGLGQDIDHDRQFVREHLKQQFVDGGASLRMVSRVVLYAPCQIVAGNGSIFDGPGTNDKDPLKKISTMKGIAQCDVVICVLSRALGNTAGVMQALTDSKFLSQLAFEPERYRLLILPYTEGSDARNGNTRRDKILNKQFDEELKISQENIIGESLVYLKKQISTLKRGVRSPDGVIAEGVTAFPFYPTLFTGLMLGKPEDMHPNFYKDLLDFTNGGRLLRFLEKLAKEKSVSAIEQLAVELKALVGSIDKMATSEVSTNQREAIEINMRAHGSRRITHAGRDLANAIDSEVDKVFGVAIKRISDQINAETSKLHESDASKKSLTALLQKTKDKVTPKNIHKCINVNMWYRSTFKFWSGFSSLDPDILSVDFLALLKIIRAEFETIMKEIHTLLKNRLKETFWRTWGEPSFQTLLEDFLKDYGRFLQITFDSAFSSRRNPISIDNLKKAAKAARSKSVKQAIVKASREGLLSVEDVMARVEKTIQEPLLNKTPKHFINGVEDIVHAQADAIKEILQRQPSRRRRKERGSVYDQIGNFAIFLKAKSGGSQISSEAFKLLEKRAQELLARAKSEALDCVTLDIAQGVKL